MNNKKILTLSILVLLFVSFVAPISLLTFLKNLAKSNYIPAVITSVSTSQTDQNDSLRRGSLLGGNTLFIQGLGLITRLSDIEIIIGDNLECPVNLALSSVFQTACTVPAGDAGSYPITVLINGYEAYCPSSICYYVYDTGYTPVFQHIVPNAITPNKGIKIGGLPRVGQSSSLFANFDQYSCVFGYYGNQDLAPNSLSFSKCQIGNLPVGYYTASFSSSCQGKSWKMKSISLIADLIFNAFDLIVVPEITGLNSNTGSSSVAEIITISGTGFSNKLSDNVVYFEGKGCGVVSSNYNQIKCSLSDPPTVQPQGSWRPGHCGLYQKTWGLQKLAALRSNSAFLKYVGLFNRLVSFEIPYNNGGGEFTGALESFFKAPVSGDYQFYLSAQGSAELYMSTTPLSKDNLVKIAEIVNGTEFRNFFNPLENNQISNTIRLEAGQFYFMQALHMAQGAEHLTVGVRVPTNQKYSMSLGEVISVKVQADVQRLETILTLTNSADLLQFLYVNGNKILRSRYFAFTSPDSIIVNALADVGIEAVVLSQTLLNSNGKVITSGTAAKVQYRLRFYTDSTLSNLPGLNKATAGTLVKATDVTPTALVSGSFKLAFSNKVISLNFDSTADDVEDAFNAAFSSKFSFKAYRYGRPEEGAQWIVYFDRNLGNIPTGRVSSSSLKGGKSGASAGLSVLQDGNSNNVLLAPITPSLLYTPEETSQVSVSVSGIRAVCSGNCSYSYTPPAPSMPTIFNFKWSGSTITINITNSGVTNASLFDELRFGGSLLTLKVVICHLEWLTLKSFVASTGTLSCSIPTNPDGTAMIAAGIWSPIVHILNVGYVKSSASVIKIQIKPTIDTITTQQIATGFLQFTIIGTGFGFGLSSSDSFGTTVNIGGVSCTLTYLSNIKITCNAHLAVTDGPVNITVNNVTASAAFVKKQPPVTLDVSGDCYLDLYGTFTNATVVSLVNNATNAVESCRTCERDNTFIRCSTCGLAPGNYTALMTTFTAPNTLKQSSVAFDIPFNVYSISPQSGSQLGGTILTITGKGFSSTVNENQVSIGSLQCKVISSTATQLKCITTANTAALTGPQDVYAYVKLEFASSCLGNCSFTYSNDFTPQVSQASSTYLKSGDQITLTGKLFSSTSQVILDGFVATIVSMTSTQLVFKVPAIQANTKVNFTVTDPAYGNYYIDSSLVFSSALVLQDVNPKTGSKGGAVLTLTGFGFSSSASVTIGSAQCQILQVSTTQITCKAPASSQGTVSITQTNFSAVTCNGCTYQYDDNLTPTVTSMTVQDTIDALTITLQGTLLNVASPVTVSLVNNDLTQPLEITQTTSNTIIATFCGTISGTYNLDVRVGNNLVLYQNVPSQQVNVTFTQASVPTNNQIISQAGGNSLVLNLNQGFLPSNPSLVSVKIAGFDCPIEFANRGRISCVIPPLRLPGLRQLATEKFLSGNWIVGNANDQPALAFDDNTATSFKGTDNNCFVGIDVGQNLVAEVSQVQFFPKIGLDLSQLYGSVIEGSNDGLAWTVFSTISSSVYSGFNTITFAAGSRPLYRYLRFRQASAISKCELAELKFKGTLFSGLSVSNTAVVSIPNVQVTINGLMQEFVANIQYRQDITPTVSAVSPAVGSSIGGTVITITGTGFGTDKTGLEVYLDDIECTVSSVQNTAIVCTTGALPDVSLRTSTPKGIVNVYVGDNGLAMNTNVRFLYAERWSDVKTWGCGGLPIEGDSVEIPVGMNLLVDMSPPKLVAVVVEGGLIFEDKNINFGCEYIMVRNGSVRIGTETAPIQSNITLTLYGDRDDEQLPIFGNKAFGMYEGRIDIHGAERSVLNTFLASTASAGSSVIIVVNAGDWKAGETIVISSTSLVASQNEKKTIASVSGNTITLTSALAYTHLGESKTVSGSSIGVKAVVSLLNRNIVIKGDDSSLESNYGAHMLFYDPGTQNTLVRISNAEFVNGGQAGFTERYPINFQNAGNQMNSYVSKCSIHSSNNKGLQIKGTQYLQVLNNTFYDIENEAIILTDGVEINNVIQDNVIIQISSSLFVYNSASTSPAISISNPLNFIRRNIIAGVLNNAFNFEFGINSQGGSYSTSICPQGERLGAFEDNYVLSCGGIALFIDNYFPRTFPCGAYRSNNQDPFSLNRPVTATFKNFIAARSMTAVQGLNLGAVVFDSFRIYDSKTGAIEVRHATHAPVNSTQVTNAFIVGNLGLSDSISVSNTWGILTPSDDGFTVNKATFANFDSSSAALQGCSNCANAWEITGSKTTFVQSLTFVNVAKRIAFTAPYYSHIFRDLDGTLTGLTNGGTVVYNFPHLQVPECSLNTAVYSGLVCTSAIELREISFWAVNPEELQDQTLGISRLQQGASLSSFSSLSYHYPQKGFSAPFATGYPYQAFFSNLLDWTNLTLKISPLYTSKDLPITLTFNYTEPREDFDVIRTVFLQADVNVTNTTTQVFDRFSKTGVSGYSFGDFYNDVANKALYLTVTGNNVGQPILDENDAAQIKVTAFQCKLHCPAPITSQFPSVTRKWSQADAWPAGKIPVAGENVVIPLTDLVVLDMDTAALGNLEIQGQLLFADNQDSITLTAKQIWVRGSMTAGTMDSPYANQAAIKLTGAITDTPFVVNFAVNVGPRALVVTGFLSFVGQPVNGVARLGANGNIGDNKILISGDISPFKKGDKVAIAPSGSNANEYETKTITDINYDTMIVTLDSGLQYFHYGSDSMYMGSDGMTMVDMRAEVVPMSRNVRIQGLDDGLGAVILATQEYNSATTVTGRIDIENALISNCGQTGTDRAAIIFELANSDQGSVLSGNVIYNSLSYGIRFTKSTSVNAMNNVIFKAKHIGILFEDNNQLIMVINNLIFGITPNARGSAVELSDFSAGIYLIDGSNANSVIAQNTVAGCSFSCYFILAPSCSIDNFFVQNIAHSGRFGYIAYGDQESCVSISGFTAYRTTYGVISYYRIAQIQASSLVLIDNTVSLNLASSSSADLRKISVTDSYFAGIALLNCPQCYADTQCSNQAAIGLNDFTTDIWPDVYSTYTTSRSSVLGSAYDFERNYFENFQDGLFASSPQCKGNNIFKTSQYATDYIPFVTVSQSTTKYVDSNSIVKFVASTGNDQNCGAGVPCTLVKNTLIKDLDGSLIQTPNPGALLPLTSEGAKASVCTSQTSTSICKSSAYALLGFKNLDTDKSQINLDPVFVANSNGFNNTVYSHRDNNPLESDDDTQKYISTVQSNSSYNVSFSNDIPVQLDFELQGQDSDYSILTIQYNTSKSIKVVNAITGATINPSITMPTSSPQILPSHPCGTYIFNRDQNYVQFKVTGESSCKLLVQQTNSVIANIRYDIAVDDFFSAGGIAPFIDKLAAVLNIPSIRIRVVEIYKGSTGIIITIDSEIQGVGSKSQASAELVDLSNNLEQAISSGSLDMYNAPVLSFSQKTVLAESHHKTTVSFMSSYKFYLVVIGAPVIIACIAGFLIYKYKVKGKKKPALKIKPRKISTKTLDLPDAMSATSSLQVNSGFKSDDDTTPKNGLIEKNTPVSRDQKRRSQMLRLGGSLTDANKNLMSNAGSIGSIGALEEIAKLTKNVQSPSKDRDDTPFATTRTMVPLMEVIPENPLTTTRQISIDNDVEFETVNDE